MAKAKHENTAVVEVKSHPISTKEAQELSFEEDQGGGFENVTAESVALPFLGVLQKGSPQVDEALGQAIEGAKAGMFFENVTGRMFDGKKGVQIVQCAFRRVYVQWTPKGVPGAGFKGELLPEAVTRLHNEGKLVEFERSLYVPKPDGSVNPKECDIIVDTRNHYVLLLDEETGGWTNALISMSKTQIKKSKMLIAGLASVKLKGANGIYTPPSFASIVRATSIGESNDKGSWFGIKFDIIGKVARPEIYEAAKAFRDVVNKGNVAAKYEMSTEGSIDVEPEKF
jgi:hypothetical protein